MRERCGKADDRKGVLHDVPEFAQILLIGEARLDRTLHGSRLRMGALEREASIATRQARHEVLAPIGCDVEGKRCVCSIRYFMVTTVIRHP